MKQPNRVKQAFKIRKSEKQTKSSQNKNFGYLFIAILFLIIASCLLVKLIL